MKTFFVLAVLSSFLLTGCAPRLVTTPPASVDQEAEAEKLMQLSRAWSDAAVAGDLEALLSYWADDAVMMAPGQPAIRGKAAIRDFVMASGQSPGFQISWEPLEAHVAASGDLAYLIERNRISTLDASGSPMTAHNKVVTVWERQPDGSWKNVVDMWNGEPAGDQ